MSRTVLRGLAAPFHVTGNPATEFVLWPGVVERISPGAFDRSLREQADVLALWGHEPDQPFARRSVGTLKLWTTVAGLAFEAWPDVTRWGQDAITAVRAGTVTGVSVGFIPRVVRWEYSDAQDVRWLEDISLIEVSVVAWPAFTATAVEAVNGSEAGHRSRRPLPGLKRRLMAMRARAVMCEVMAG